MKLGGNYPVSLNLTFFRRSTRSICHDVKRLKLWDSAVQPSFESPFTYMAVQAKVKRNTCAWALTTMEIYRVALQQFDGRGICSLRIWISMTWRTPGMPFNDRHNDLEMVGI